MATIHIIGAGLAGLSTALRLSGLGCRVVMYEASPQAGGRCRSYHDAQLDCLLDNGNHLVLSGNTSVQSYLQLVGAQDQLVSAASHGFQFLDLMNELRWTVQPSKGRIPWWVMSRRRRVPNTRLVDYGSGLSVLAATIDQTVMERVGKSHPLYRPFWEPFTIAVLNADPSQASARLLRPVLMETFAKGWGACTPMIARETLAKTFLEPALQRLTNQGADIRFGARVRGLKIEHDRIQALNFGGDELEVSPQDQVILAVPAWIAPSLVPGLSAPDAGEPIVNVHYRLDRHWAEPDLIGLIGGLSQWVFVRDNVASVTISAAREVVEQSADTIATHCWREVAAALRLGDLPMPPVRVVKERRATFDQSPAALSKRSGPQTHLSNLVIAGDWTATGLPATIEGAIRSGEKAARYAKKKLTF